MGYCMTQDDCRNFLLKKTNFSKALKAIKELKGGGRYGDARGRHYAWVTDSEYVTAKTLPDALQAWRWHLIVNEEGDATELIFEGEKLGDDEVLLRAIAPFVESGELCMRGEDGAVWKWEFRNKKLLEMQGRVVYSNE